MFGGGGGGGVVIPVLELFVVIVKRVNCCCCCYWCFRVCCYRQEFQNCLLLSSRVSELLSRVSELLLLSSRVVRSFRVVFCYRQEFQSCLLLSSRVSELFVVIVKSFRVVGCCWWWWCWCHCCCWCRSRFRRLFVVIVTDIVALVKRVNWWWWWWCHCSRFIGCLLSLLTLSLSSGELFVVAVVIGGFRGGLLLSLLTLFLSRESNVCCWCRQSRRQCSAVKRKMVVQWPVAAGQGGGLDSYSFLDRVE